MSTTHARRSMPAPMRSVSTSIAQSKRFIELEVARQIAESCQIDVAKVGVFVNHSLREIQDAIESLRPVLYPTPWRRTGRVPFRTAR